MLRLGLLRGFDQMMRVALLGSTLRITAMICDGGGSGLFRCSDRSGTGAESNTTLSMRLVAVKHRPRTALERKALRLVVAGQRPSSLNAIGLIVDGRRTTLSDPT